MFLRANINDPLTRHFLTKNVERQFLIFKIGIVTFFLMLGVDFINWQKGLLNTNPYVQATTIFRYLALSFFISVYLLRKRYNSYTPNKLRFHVTLNIFLFVLTLFPRSLLIMMDRQVTGSYYIFILILNVVLLLDLRPRILLMGISLILMLLTIHQAANPYEILKISLAIEVSFATVLSTYVGHLLYRAEATNFYAKKDLEEKHLALERSLIQLEKQNEELNSSRLKVQEQNLLLEESKIKLETYTQALEQNRALLEEQNKALEENKSRLQESLAFSQNQLTGYALSMAQKNDLLLQLKSSLEKPDASHHQALRLVDQGIGEDDIWKRFHHHFEQLHPEVVRRLENLYPELSASDLRLFALLKLKITTKEIADLLGISPESANTARYRLRKRLGLNEGEDLQQFVDRFE
ncbi:MAG TPA: hypothetical protein PKM27_06320 [Saprospiraceae bacterium]|nr:hypothetical protein [Saprospiraceae bacterium]HNT21857.1 hypothetical protein [Saprospiraceae bacterium]